MAKQLSRRTMLRGMGTAIALPLLDAMLPPTGSLAPQPAAATAAAGPKRLAWLYVPNGIDMQNWTPATFGRGLRLTPTLMPLSKMKDRMMVVTGMVCEKANANGDGPGDHARAMAAYLTGVQPRKTEGANIHLGISADQLAASKIGYMTRLPFAGVGHHRRRVRRPLRQRIQLRLSAQSLLEKRIHAGREGLLPAIGLRSNVRQCRSQRIRRSQARREERKKSVLDFVLSDAKSMQGQSRRIRQAKAR